MFWLPFGNRYTHPGEGLCQISHFIPEVNDFTQILALAPLLKAIHVLRKGTNLWPYVQKFLPP